MTINRLSSPCAHVASGPRARLRRASIGRLRLRPLRTSLKALIIHVLLAASLGLPSFAHAWKMEVEEVIVPSTRSFPQFTRVTFQQPYKKPPLVFVTPASEGPQPVNVRLRNIDTQGFDIILTEPPGEDGYHVGMTLVYMALDAGRHYLPDGTIVEAGTVDTMATQQADPRLAVEELQLSEGTWHQVNFSEPFGYRPAVLGQIQTMNNETADVPREPSQPFLTTAIDRVYSDQFNIALERSQTSTGEVTKPETIAWFALRQNAISRFDLSENQHIIFEAFRTPHKVLGWEDGFVAQNLRQNYPRPPVFVANKNTRRETDGGWVRRSQQSTPSSLYVTVDEDLHADNERKRKYGEAVGGIVWSSTFTAEFDDAPPMTLSDIKSKELYYQQP